MTPPAAAIDYATNDFTVDRKDILGRHSASHGFINAIARHVDSDPLYCLVRDPRAGAQFAEHVTRAAGRGRTVKAIHLGNLRALAEPGCVMRYDPAISDLAWQRRVVGQRTFSIVGITHSLSSTAVMDLIGQSLLAPLQPWDALICTSSAAHRTVSGLLERWADYLQERVGGRPRLAMQLPVIPLGVDCDRFAHGPSAERARAELRGELGAGPEDVVVLFFGRLSFHGKAHPAAMARAVETAAAKSVRRLHLLFCGQFPNAGIGKAYREVVHAYAPSVKLHFIEDLGNDDRPGKAWHAADIFLSLSDNIQETFGLTPIEAQAAGLPVVVSDWDGYRDTVIDGETGYRVPTLIPWAGTGQALISAHALGTLTYDRYIGGVSLMTVVDVEAAAQAIARLADDNALRRRMGSAGRRLAESRFDWAVVVRRVRELWGDLAALRQEAEELVPRRRGAPLAPLRDDPFRVFAGFATRKIGAATRVRATGTARDLAAAQQHKANVYLDDFLLPASEIEKLRTAVEGGAGIGEAINSVAGNRVAQALASLSWMAKLGIVSFDDGEQGD